MKRCPTCQKTFDDAMRFCQTDGTPLVDDAPPADPYKTMVASKEDIQAALSGTQNDQPASAEIGAPEDEPLEIPSAPPASHDGSEFQTKLAGSDDSQVIEIPPLTEAPPEPPKFNEPNAPPPSFGSGGTPASPFSSPPSSGPGDFPTTPPIPSPFNDQRASSFSAPEEPKSFEPLEEEEKTYFEPEPAVPTFAASESNTPTPQFADPEPEQQFNPFDQPAAPQSAPIAQSEWAPPPTPTQGGSGMSPSPSAGAKLNQTLPIVSLVAGILSLCCWISPVTGIVALITGFLGMKNVKNDPAHYGGKTLALVGMILGGLFFIVGLVYWIVILFFNGAAWLMQLANQG